MTETLAPEEVAARIKAARLLRGISQDELARKLVDAGLPRRLVGSLERGETELRAAPRAALSQALGFPERWFLVAVDELCVEAPEPDLREVLTRIERKLDRLVA